MSPTLNGSSAIRRFKGSDAIEIRDGVAFDFYTGLPHMLLLLVLIVISDRFQIFRNHVLTQGARSYALCKKRV